MPLSAAHRGPLRPGHVFSIDPQLRVPEERLYILQRARMLSAYSNSVEEAVATMK